MWDVPDVSRASRRLTQTRIFKGSTLPLRSNTLTTLTALTLHDVPHFTAFLFLYTFFTENTISGRGYTKATEFPQLSCATQLLLNLFVDVDKPRLYWSVLLTYLKKRHSIIIIYIIMFSCDYFNDIFWNYHIILWQFHMIIFSWVHETITLILKDKICDYVKVSWNVPVILRNFHILWRNVHVILWFFHIFTWWFSRYCIKLSQHCEHQLYFQLFLLLIIGCDLALYK